MPELARFLGLVLMINTRGEHPPPHIHVKYGSKKASVKIDDGTIIAGDLPSKQYKRVKDWLIKNKQEAMEIWNEHND